MNWLRLFRLTKWEYYADFFITPPITLALLVASVREGISPLWFGEVAIGLLGWSLYEYALHRWVLHRAWFFREMHELHHAKQTDYIAIHPILTLTIYVSLWAAFGFGSSAAMIGFSLGYIAYSIAHTAFHYAHIPKGHWLYGMKMRHAAHHRTDVNFGVTASVWDKLFNTEGNRP
jgi:sterol desaturase/sphingolipid hydroxylase (fatty acid hydroxylase superfamily)